MWAKISGKSSDVESRTDRDRERRHKGESSSSSRRHRAGSDAGSVAGDSVSSSRRRRRRSEKDRDRDRHRYDDIRERDENEDVDDDRVEVQSLMGTKRVYSYPEKWEDEGSVADSYATARSTRGRDEYHDRRRDDRDDKDETERLREEYNERRRRERDERRDDERRRDRDRDEKRDDRDDRKSARDGREERRRSTKDRDDGRDRDDRGDRDERRRDRDRERDSTRGLESSWGVESSRAEPPLIPGQFPDAYDPVIVHTHNDPHVANQFPGQFPTEPSAPFRPPIDTQNSSGSGLAADYYGDQGESVHNQPGIRPEVLINSQPHLQPASAVPQTPQETGNGSAADFFSSESVDVGAQSSSAHPSRPGKASSERPSRPGKTSGSGVLPTAAALAGVGALAYGATHHNSGSSSAAQAAGHHSESYTHSTSYQGQSHLSAGAAGDGYSSATSSPRHSPSHSPRPGKHHSKLPQYALGAGLAAAGAAYAAHELHEHHNHSHDTHMSGALGGHPNAPGYQNGYNKHNGHNTAAYAAGGMASMHRHEHKGPMNKFVDWWKDYEDVRKMEAYTEAIGVCRYCFDPDTSVMDAPRKHHYNRKRTRSEESLRKKYSGRVDKESRYYGAAAGSGDEKKKHKSGAGKWLTAGVLGYGLAKAGEAVGKRHNEFDSHSIKSGRFLRSRSNSPSKRSKRSSTSRGVIRHDNSSFISQEVVEGADGNYRIERRRRRRDSNSSSSSSSSNSGHHRMSGALAGAAAAGLAASALGKSRKDRSRSRSRERKPSHRRHGSSVGSEKLSIYRRSNGSRSSFEGSRADLATGAGFLGGFFGGRKLRRRSSGSKRRKSGFFNFGNGSSSSSEGLVYGTDIRAERRRKASEKKIKRKSSSEKLNATLAGLAVTGAALAAAKAGKRPSHKSEVFAAKHKKGSSSHGSRGQVISSLAGHEEDGWESASDGESSSSSSRKSWDDGLAYGSYAKGRKSTDSLASNGSGTWKWGWRWGDREKKKNKRKSTDHIAANMGGGIAPAAAAAIAGAAAAGAVSAAVGRHDHHDAMSTTSSQPSMQTVYPIQSHDPNAFDAVRRDGAIYTSRPEAQLPMNAPQPILPVSSGSIYSQSAAAYVAPSGPPVDFSVPPPKPPRPDRRYSESDRERERRSERDKRRRRDDSAPEESHFGRDAAIAGGITAAATVGAIAASSSRKKDSSVRFDLDSDRSRRRDEELRREKDVRREEERRVEERRREEERRRQAEYERQQEAVERARAEKRDADARAAVLAREAERKAEEQREAAREAARREAEHLERVEREEREAERRRLESEKREEATTKTITAG